MTSRDAIYEDDDDSTFIPSSHMGHEWKSRPSTESFIS